MNRFILTIAAVAVAGILFPDSSLHATPPKGGKGSSRSKMPQKSFQPSKTKTQAHHHVHDRSYRGWTRLCWFPSYGCYGFYDPSTNCWYYWYEQAGQFQPVELMATSMPTTSGASLLPVGAVNVPSPNTSTGPVAATAPVPPAQPVRVDSGETLPVSDGEIATGATEHYKALSGW